MELKEGMYIRTKYNDFCNMVAIRKIDEIDDDGSFWIDDYIIDTYGDEQNKLHEEDVEFAREDIVNVIKPGDYVNGMRIIAIDSDDRIYVAEDLGQPYDREFSNGCFEYTLLDKKTFKIKSIVTKEQFALMAYEVE